MNDGYLITDMKQLLERLELYFIIENMIFKTGLSKKETCLRGRAAMWPRGRVAENNYHAEVI